MLQKLQNKTIKLYIRILGNSLGIFQTSLKILKTSLLKTEQGRRLKIQYQSRVPWVAPLVQCRTFGLSSGMISGSCDQTPHLAAHSSQSLLEVFCPSPSAPFPVPLAHTHTHKRALSFSEIKSF